MENGGKSVEPALKYYENQFLTPTQGKRAPNHYNLRNIFRAAQALNTLEAKKFSELQIKTQLQELCGLT